MSAVVASVTVKRAVTPKGGDKKIFNSVKGSFIGEDFFYCQNYRLMKKQY